MLPSVVLHLDNKRGVNGLEAPRRKHFSVVRHKVGREALCLYSCFILSDTSTYSLSSYGTLNEFFKPLFPHL